MPLPRITRKRQLVQGILIIAALLLPFISISGHPFLRMDIGKGTFYLASVPLRIDQFYLVLLVSLLCVVLFLLVTAVLGRVWCGWLCPQTIFNDLMDAAGRRSRAVLPPSAARVTEHLAAVAIAALIAFDLFCWFMPPGQAAEDLSAVARHPLMGMTFLLLTVSGYLNLVMVRRSFCRSYCPYGRFQAALMDAGTLNLSFLEESRARCLQCNACVRTCPMDIDIREGFQIECIGCGRCIDACRSVMEKRPDAAGLIDYRFGTVKGVRFVPGRLTIVLSVLTLLLAAGFVLGVTGRNQNAFAVQRVATAEARRMPDGSMAYPWRAIIGNRSETARTYTIRVAGDPAAGVELLGQTGTINVAPNQHREVTFMIHPPVNFPPSAKIVLQLQYDDRPAASVTVTP